MTDEALREQVRQLRERQAEDRIAMQRIADTLTITNRLLDVTAEKLKNVDTKVDKHIVEDEHEHGNLWAGVSSVRRMLLLFLVGAAGAGLTVALQAAGNLA